MLNFLITLVLGLLLAIFVLIGIAMVLFLGFWIFVISGYVIDQITGKFPKFTEFVEEKLDL